MLSGSCLDHSRTLDSSKTKLSDFLSIICRTPDSSKARAGNGQGFLAGCRDALPGLAGSIIAIAAMVLIGRSGSAPTQSTNEPESEEAQEEVCPHYGC